MICIAFFFCLCPGEYTRIAADNQAFSLNNVAFLSEQGTYTTRRAPPKMSCYQQPTITTQKNGNGGVVIAPTHSNNPLCYPVASVMRKILLHRQMFYHKHISFYGTFKLACYYNHNNINVPVKSHHGNPHHESACYRIGTYRRHFSKNLLVEPSHFYRADVIPLPLHCWSDA